MLKKLTNVRVLDEKMKRHVLGGLGDDCKQQCYEDCGLDHTVRKNQDGNAEGKKIGNAPPVP